MVGLKKVLSFRVILLITINAIMGTGIFFLPAVGAKSAGPASLVSWGIMGVIAIYISMCFAELTSMYPKAGGVYEFCKHAYGRFVSFMIGWMTLLAGNITIAMLVVGAVQYLLPYNYPLISIPVSLLFVFIFNYIAYRGMQTSSVMLVAFSLITLGTIFGLIVPGLFSMDFGNLAVFMPFGISSIFVTIFLIAETFFGWETATFLAEETKKGERVIPKALVISTVAIAVVCLVFVFVSLAGINWKIFGESSAPLIDMSNMFYGEKAGSIFTILVYLSIIGSVAGWIVSAPRLILAMARDNLFIKQFASIHPKRHTPYKAIIFQTILTSIIVVAGVGSYNMLLLILLPIVLLMYSAVILSVTILRYKQPDRKRYYRVPFGKIGPIVMVLILLSIIVYWVYKTHGSMDLIFFIGSLIVLGLPLYLLLEMYYTPSSIRKINNSLAYFAYIFENFFLPNQVRKEVMNLLGDIKGKKVLEFGCGVGTLTEPLAAKVGKRGKIYATDVSEKLLYYAKKRIERKGHKHVKIMHDPKHMERVHPGIPKVDVIVSIADLSYVSNVDNVLKGMNKILKKNSRIIFVEFDKFYSIIPNKDWICDDKRIKAAFSRAGFSVDISRKKGWFWRYVYIVGKKVKNV